MKYPIKTNLMPLVCLKQTKQTKNKKEILFHLVQTGEIYRNYFTNKEADQIEETGLFSGIYMLNALSRRKDKKPVDQSFLYAEFIPFLPNGESGILFRVLGIDIAKIDYTKNIDSRTWREQKRADIFPFIISRSGKILTDDGKTRYYQLAEGRYYNKAVVSALTTLSRADIANGAYLNDELAKFINIVDPEKLDLYGGASLWKFVELYKNIKPRYTGEKQKAIDTLKSAKWDINGYLTKETEKYLKEKLSVSKVWVVDPRQDDTNSAIWHLLSISTKTPIKEIGKMYIPEEGDPIILGGSYEYKGTDKISISSLVYTTFRPLPNAMATKNKYTKLAQEYGNVIVPYMIKTNKLCRDLHNEGNTEIVNIIAEAKIMDRMGELYQAFCISTQSELKTRSFGNPPERDELNSIIKTFRKANGPDGDKTLLDAFVLFFHYFKYDTSIQIKHTFRMFYDIRNFMTRGRYYQMFFKTHYLSEYADPEERKFYYLLTQLAKRPYDYDELELIEETILALYRKYSKYHIAVPIIPEFKTWGELKAFYNKIK